MGRPPSVPFLLDLVKIPQKVLKLETVKLDRGFMMCPGDVEGANELVFMDTDEARQGSPEEFLKQCVVFPAYF